MVNRNWYKWVALDLLMILLCSPIIFHIFKDENDKNNTYIKESLDCIKMIASVDHENFELSFWGDGKDYYYYFLPSGCDLNHISVRTKQGITIRKEGEEESKRVEYFNNDTLKGLSLEENYLLGCYDENHYLYEVPVIFMQSENLSSVHIYTDNEDITAVLEDKDTKLPGQMFVFDENGHNCYKGNLKYIKGRGNASWFSHKKPFHIKIEKEANFLNLGNTDEFCLLSQEMDKSYLRNYLAFDAAKNAKLAYTPNGKLIDLWIDGIYWGVYFLTNQIGVGEASVHISDLESKTQEVNQDALSYYTNLSENKFVHYFDIPNDPADISGGYLLEVDKFYYKNKQSRFHTNQIYDVTIKSPEYISKRQMEYISSLVQNMENSFVDKSSKEYQNYIDFTSWVKMGVLQELFVNADFMGSSQFFYKDRDQKGKRSLIFAGPVWDMDQTLGPNTSSFYDSSVALMVNYDWYKDLYPRPEFYQAIIDCYKMTYRPWAEKMLNGEIDAEANKLKQAVRLNNIRWQHTFDIKQYPDHQFNEEIAHLKAYLKERVNFLDELWIEESEFHKVSIYTDPVQENFHYIYFVPDGGALPTIRDPNNLPNRNFVNWRYGTLSNPGDIVNKSDPVNGDVTIFAEYSK